MTKKQQEEIGAAVKDHANRMQLSMSAEVVKTTITELVTSPAAMLKFHQQLISVAVKNSALFGNKATENQDKIMMGISAAELICNLASSMQVGHDRGELNITGKQK